MTPIFTFYNKINSLNGYAKFFSKSRLASALNWSRSYINNLGFGQLRRANSFAVDNPSVFRISIAVVIESCSEEKMCWVNAISYITGMAHEHTFWNWPNMHLVALPMGTRLSTIKHDPDTVTFVVQRPSPQPTSIRLINFFPKSFHNDMIAEAA